MGFMDEIRKLTHPYSDAEDDYDDYDDEDYDDEDEPIAAPATPAPRRGFPRNVGPVDATPRTTAASPAGRVVSLNNNTQLQVILVKTDRFDQVDEIANHLRERKAVVLNLESTNKDVARRLVDFLSGCAFALDGKIKKVALSTYLITPHNVTVAGDLAEQLENSGMYF